MDTRIPSDKNSLIIKLQNSLDEFINTFTIHGEDFFTYAPEDKWTSGQHLIHLTKINKGAAQALSVSKLILRISNGLQKEPLRDYQTLKTEYYTALAQLPKGAGAAKPGEAPQDLNLAIEKYQKYATKLIDRLKHYDERDLDKYRIPHPLYGKIPLIEFLYFVDFHVVHHLNALNEYYIPHYKKHEWKS